MPETEPTLRERVDLFVERVTRQAPKHWRKATHSGRDDMLPLAHLLLRDGDEHVLGTKFVGPHAKPMFERLLKEYAREHDAIAIAFTSEAWLSAVPPDEPIDSIHDYEGVMPSERADRLEVLLLSFDTPFGQSMQTWKIDRTGKRAKLVKHVGTGGSAGGTVEGRFGGVEKVQ